MVGGRKSDNMKKIIVAFAGEKGSGKTTASMVLQSKGFHRISVDDKVKEVAKSLSVKLDENLVATARQKGYNISRLYWINLIMASIPKDVSRIVIDDFQEKDKIDQVIAPFYISRSADIKPPKGFISIRNLGDEEQFKELIVKIFENIGK